MCQRSDGQPSLLCRKQSRFMMALLSLITRTGRRRTRLKSQTRNNFVLAEKCKKGQNEATDSSYQYIKLGSGIWKGMPANEMSIVDIHYICLQGALLPNKICIWQYWNFAEFRLNTTLIQSRHVWLSMYAILILTYSSVCTKRRRSP